MQLKCDPSASSTLIYIKTRHLLCPQISMCRATNPTSQPQPRLGGAFFGDSRRQIRTAMQMATPQLARRRLSSAAARRVWRPDSGRGEAFDRKRRSCSAGREGCDEKSDRVAARVVRAAYRQTAMAIANASGVTTRPIRTQALYTSALLGNMKKWTTIHRHTANPTATLIRSLGARKRSKWFRSAGC
jgi:hypothetical protein